MRIDITESINNVALDTEFFISQNFLAGTKLKEIAKLSKEKIIKGYITDITYREVISRFSKNLIKAKEDINKPLDLMLKAARILKNSSEHQFYFILPTIDVDSVCINFRQQFDKWIKVNRFEIIKTDHIVIGDIMNDYFSNSSPFKDGKKKSEFPDAFTLKALNEYFINKKSKSYILSRDVDIASYKSAALIPVLDGAELIDKFIRQVEEKNKTKTIKSLEKLFDKNKDDLEEDLIQTIETYLEDEIKFEVRRKRLEMYSFKYVEASNIRIDPFSIVYLDSDKANLEAMISFDVNSKFITIDPQHSWYNIDLGMAHWTDAVENNIRTSLYISVVFYVNLKASGGPIISIESINSGEDFEIMEYVKTD